MRHKSRISVATIAMLFTLATGFSSTTWALSGAFSQMASDLKDSYRVTTPTSHIAQGRGFASGGGVRVRFRPAPMLGFKLWEVKAPDFSASCSGVDIHLGSLSLIDKQQLIDMIQALPGMSVYLVYLALKKYCGACATTLAFLQDLINRWGEFTLGNCEDNLEALMSDEPWGVKATAARDHVMKQFSGKDPSSQDSGEVNSDGAAANIVKSNVVYKHFIDSGFEARILPGFTKIDVINLAQSMTGTILIEPKQVDGETTFGDPIAIPPASIEDLSLRTFLYGGELKGNVCSTTVDHCFNVKSRETIVTIAKADAWPNVVMGILDPSKPDSVINRLRVHVDYANAGSTSQLTADEAQIIGAIPGPLFALARNLAVNNIQMNHEISSAIANDMALDAAYEFLLDISTEAMTGIAGIDRTATELHNKLNENVIQLQADLRAEYRALKEENRDQLSGALEMLTVIEMLRGKGGK